MARKILDDSSSDSSSESDVEGAEFKINEDFAKKFEYNKKREELQKRRLISPSIEFV